MEKETFATEIIRELNRSNKRWFTAFLVILLLWFATIGLFIYYVSLPVEDYQYEVTQTSDNNAENQIIGGDYNALQSDSESN